MEKLSNNSNNDGTKNIFFDEHSLNNCSREELITLAKDLSIGSFDKESIQRRKILQMIADRLSERNGSPP